MKTNSIRLAAILSCMLGSTVMSFAQVKIGANPSTIDVSSAMEVEAANGNKTVVNKTNGQLRIQDGTQGADRVLTSDANGNASWKNISEAKVPATVFIGNHPGGTVLVADENGAVGSRVPITPVAAYSANWDVTNKAYVVPVAGYYRSELVSSFSISTNDTDGRVDMTLHGKLNPTSSEAFRVSNRGVRSLVETAYYNVGDLIYAHISYSSTPNGNVYQSNMNITYLP
jgi:hypothetical protein